MRPKTWLRIEYAAAICYIVAAGVVYGVPAAVMLALLMYVAYGAGKIKEAMDESENKQTDGGRQNE